VPQKNLLTNNEPLFKKHLLSRFVSRKGLSVDRGEPDIIIRKDDRLSRRIVVHTLLPESFPTARQGHPATYHLTADTGPPFSGICRNPLFILKKLIPEDAMRHCAEGHRPIRSNWFIVLVDCSQMERLDKNLDIQRFLFTVLRPRIRYPALILCPITKGAFSCNAQAGHLLHRQARNFKERWCLKHWRRHTIGSWIIVSGKVGCLISK
jgi:hypothetical protein